MNISVLLTCVTTQWHPGKRSCVYQGSPNYGSWAKSGPRSQLSI